MSNRLQWSFMGSGQGQKFLPTNYNEFKRSYSGNSGNLVFYFATQCAVKFEGNSVGVGTSADILNNNNGIIVSMANQLGEHTDLSVNGLKLKNLDVPLVGLGLGAQVKTMTDDCSFIPKGTVEWLKDFVSKSPTSSPSITLRGDYTYSIMEKLGFADNVVSLGCQTNFINPRKNLGETISHLVSNEKIDKITVAAGSPYNKIWRKLEASLLSLAMESNGDYVVQHPEGLIKLAANFSEEEFQEGWDKVFPVYEQFGFNEKVFLKAVKNHFKLYTDVPQWIRSHRQSDVVVGTRIHGIQSALQAGIPAICLYIDSRTKELCEKMKIPHAPANDFTQGITRNDIYRILKEWDYEEYDRNRLFLANTLKDFLHNNKVPIGNTLLNLTS